MIGSQNLNESSGVLLFNNLAFIILVTLVSSSLLFYLFQNISIKPNKPMQKMLAKQISTNKTKGTRTKKQQSDPVLRP